MDQVRAQFFLATTRSLVRASKTIKREEACSAELLPAAMRCKASTPEKIGRVSAYLVQMSRKTSLLPALQSQCFSYLPRPPLPLLLSRLLPLTMNTREVCSSQLDFPAFHFSCAICWNLSLPLNLE